MLNCCCNERVSDLSKVGHRMFSTCRLEMLVMWGESWCDPRHLRFLAEVWRVWQRGPLRHLDGIASGLSLLCLNLPSFHLKQHNPTFRSRQIQQKRTSSTSFTDFLGSPHSLDLRISRRRQAVSSSERRVLRKQLDRVLLCSLHQAPVNKRIYIYIYIYISILFDTVCMEHI